MSTGRFTMSAQRLALLSNLLKEEGIDRAPTRTVPPRPDRDAPVPLTFSQSRIWFLDRFAAHTSAYVISTAMRVQGDFRTDLFARACAEVVRRHESLRTVFVELDGRPHQQVRAELPPDVRVEDVAGVAPEAVDDELRRREEELINQPFDLATGPLLRVRLLRFGPQQTGVLLNLHHIVSDRWSMGVLLRELIAGYRALLTGLPSDLPELPVQYADFADWQQQPAAQEAWAADLAYWTDQLGGAPPEIGLVGDRPRPREKSYRGDSVPVAIPPAVVTRLRELARQENATLFMVLGATFKALLHRLTGDDEIVVGSPVANRRLVELEPLIGLFMNTLALRTDLRGDPSFRELLRRVSAVCLAAYDHQGIPFERLVEQLQPERSVASTPVFQVLFSYQNVPFPAWHDGPARVEPVSLDARKAEFDLLLDLFEDGDTIWGRLEYSTDLYDEVTAERHVRMFHRLLRGLLDDPDTPISALPLVGPGERDDLLALATGPAPAAGADRPLVVDAFASAVRRDPAAPAVRFGSRTVSYGELDTLVDALAGRLRAAGVRRGTPVGVRLDRSVELMAAPLAVWRAGGVLVPVDPTLPADRTAALLAEAGVALLLAQRPKAGALPWSGPTCLVDDPSADPTGAGADPGPVALTGGDAAYVSCPAEPIARISVHHHAALRDRLHWLRDTAGLTAGDRVLQQTPTSAPAAVWELCAPLLAGAAVVLARPGGERDARHLVSLIRAEQVSVACLRPDLLAELLDQRGVERCTALRHVFCAGAPLTRELAALFARRSPAALHHLLVPADVAAPVTAHLCAVDGAPTDPAAEAGTDEGGYRPPLPVGRPVAGARVHVLDRYGQPVPVGVVGELAVGGAAVPGGPGAQDLTPDPFGTGTDARLLRTGELGRVRVDGVIEHLGHRDRRLRLRGFPVDLDLVEATLTGHPGITGAVVAARGEDRDARLVAYLAGDAVPTAGELATYLKEWLPEHLIPAACVELPELPRTPAGTVDRIALPEPEPAGGAQPTGHLAPQDEVEHGIADIWRELLGVDAVGLTDSFFVLGGHSLLATKLAARIEARFGVRVPLRELFDNPTVGGLADIVRQDGTGADAEPAPIPRVDRDGYLPLSFSQEHLVRHHPRGPVDPIHNVVTAVRLTGPLDEAALRRSLDDIVARHEALRTRIVDGPDGPAQRVEATGNWPLETVDLSAVDPAEQAGRLRALVEEQGRRPFRIEAEPMVRGLLARLGHDEQALVLTIHHLVTDNWSYGVLVRDLSEYYTAHCTGRTPALPALDVQYPDVAAWQRRQLAAGALDTHLDHWRRTLRDLPPALTLQPPVCGTGTAPRPAATGSTRAFRVDPTVTAKLRQLAQGEGASLFMVLLAAYDVLLAACSGRDDIPVGFPEAGRERPETAELVGWFVNPLVVRADLTAASTFRELVLQVRDRTLDAYAHRAAPLWLATGPGPASRSTRVLFNLLNAEVPELTLPGLRVRSLDIGDDYVFSEVLGSNLQPAEVDLALIMREQGTELVGTWLYSTDVFDARALDLMMRRWTQVLGRLADEPAATVDALRQVAA
ncbi:condensation domain-containing protein [Micromonospora yasonensis]|uniref:condensation domain-containing protein n=1 Tax=Micromonospora yasonensis TaxID=1128667 RepID=UPI0022322702|nr:condensation domain-containing protein [Micromonospora yasonensis]MCW3844163.1 condensation domain-containing protein [Micromonospora yasonensis]